MKISFDYSHNSFSSGYSILPILYLFLDFWLDVLIVPFNKLFLKKVALDEVFHLCKFNFMVSWITESDVLVSDQLLRHAIAFLYLTDTSLRSIYFWHIQSLSAMTFLCDLLQIFYVNFLKINFEIVEIFWKDFRLLSLYMTLFRRDSIFLLWTFV